MSNSGLAAAMTVSHAGPSPPSAAAAYTCQERSLAASADGEEEMTMTKLALAIAFLMAATTYAQAQSWGMARRTGLTHQDRPRYHREPCWSAAAKPDCQQKARATQKLRPLVSR